jgi:pimeloyl-ACP methyl ester carboxylesterase
MVEHREAPPAARLLGALAPLAKVRGVTDDAESFQMHLRRQRAVPRPRKTPVLHHLPRVADRLVLNGLKLKGYRSRKVRTSVGRLHLLDAEGEGTLPPVVVLHGLSASGQYYENLMRRIRPRVRRVIAPDMPGHGYSDLPAGGLDEETLKAGLKEGLDQVLDEPAILFGNSLGGVAAVRYAVERPENVLALILAAPGGAPMEEQELSRFMDAFMLDGHGKALDFVDRLFHRPHPMRHVLAWGVRQQFGRTGIEDLMRSVRPQTLLRPEELQGLAMPVFVYWGEADRVLWPEHRKFFELNLPPHAELHRIEEYGHVPHMSHPDCLAVRVIEVARRVDRAQRSRDDLTRAAEAASAPPAGSNGHGD